MLIFKGFRLVLTGILFTVSSMSFAQLSSAIIGIDGLTCSACSFGTQKSIMKLDFVDSVKMELNSNIADVYFKKDKTISIDALSDKVYDAGFSVRSVQGIFNFTDLTITDNYCFEDRGVAYQFIGVSEPKKLNGVVVLKFVGNKRLSKKEFKKWKDTISKTIPCKTGKDQKVYYVTL